ncbi:MAG: tyrosine-protein phosphatase [Natronospirillum sp.]
MFADFGILRLFFNFPVEVAPGIWRSSQPTPGRIRRLARRGVVSVLNLRGQVDEPFHHLEAYACNEADIAFYNIHLSSGRPPSKEQLHELHDMYLHAKRPLLLHCKSGADRAGLISTLFLMWSGVPLSAARSQLSKRFLHFKEGRTGVLDTFLDDYERAEQATGIDFWSWVDKEYDRDAVSSKHRPTKLGTLLVDKILRRE